MIPYPRGLILENSNNYGIMKTETLIGFGPSNRDGHVNQINNTEPLEWIITHGNFAPRSLKVTDTDTSKKYHTTIQVTTAKPQPKSKKKTKKRGKKKQKRKGKVKKCIVKFLNKGDNEGKRGKRKGGKIQKMQKKFMLPLLLGLLAAKSLLIPVALKALAFMSAKGLMMGFFSTVLASVLSLKGMFEHSHASQNRKEDSNSKTQVEIIQVPSKSEDHVYYDEHYRRGDYEPVPNIITK